MKYIVLLGDGMSDYPIEELGGKTVLEHANTPNMDKMARTGVIGLARTVPEGMPPGSDVANLSVLGYDPRKYYTGRAPLEAASVGVELGPEDVAYRCNLVTLGGTLGGAGKAGGGYCKACVMEDFSAGHITSEEAAKLMAALDKELGSDEVKFYPGVSYRHLMVWKSGRDKAECTPPHDITGKAVGSHLPKGDGADFITGLMERSMGILGEHEVNLSRVREKKRPANSIWLWGQGKRPALPPFREMYGISGAMISAVDLMNGIARLVGFEVVKVPGATGYIDTDYQGKADAALEALDRVDLVYVHVEAPDEAAHGGNLGHKVKAVEEFDAKVVGTVMKKWAGKEGLRVLVMPDHPTPVAVKSHTSDPVPFIIWDSGAGQGATQGGTQGATQGAGSRKNPDAAYTEAKAKDAGVFFEDGYRLMGRLIKG